MTEASEFIRPETVCAKLAAHKNLQAPKFSAALAACPRLVELAWFLQAQSLQPGGLRAFVPRFLQEFSDRIGTPSMHKIGKIEEPYTPEESAAVMRDVPCGDDRATWLHEESDQPLAIEDRGPDADYLDEPLRWRRNEEMNFLRLLPTLDFVRRQNHAYFFRFCRRAALMELPRMLGNFCADSHDDLPGAWWFHDLRGALVDAMDSHASRIEQTIARTVVASDIFRALKFALDEKAMVKIIGESRFGKTESVKVWSAMHPGLARLVKTPSTFDERSFLEALADAVGLARGLEVTNARLRSALEYIMRHSGLMFIFDESAWLIPTRYTTNTTPYRLNYIRSQILDHGNAVALVETPQFTAGAAHRFEKKTGFNMTQWNGRIMRTVTLPAELPEQDLSAVVNLNFPALSRASVKKIVGIALTSENYLFAVEKVAKNARAAAREQNREQITEADIEAGIMLAGFTAPRAPLPAPAPSTPSTPAKSTPSRTSTMSTRPRRFTPAPEAVPARNVAPLSTIETIHA